MLSFKPRRIIHARFALGNLATRRGLSARASEILSSLGISTSEGQIVKGVYDGEWGGTGEPLVSTCPATGEKLARVSTASASEVSDAVLKSRLAYKRFRNIPAPRRGEIVRQIREAIAAKIGPLGALISLEMGKIKTEGLGEVQEFVDICDYATGLSRMMNGRVIASERVGHSIFEVPNPLGVVGVLSAFNFPVAVYGWNLSLSMAAGNATLWKPSPTTPLCAVAVTKIISGVLDSNGIDGAVASLVCGDKMVGETIVKSSDVDMVSFTGSEHVGRIVGTHVQSRFGKVLLELGGNNAAIIMPDADMSLAFPSILFSAVGTAGQRCTSTRRLYLHKSIAPIFLERLQAAYATIPIGDPLNSNTLIGPLHTRSAVKAHQDSIADIRASGGSILTGGNLYIHPQDELKNGNFVLPAIAVPNSSPSTAAAKEKVDRIWNQETFAPVLKVALFDELEEAIELNNSVPQGLSSSLWSNDVRNLGKWIGPNGSDAGIVNFNAGTSGAEIGAAFGGNKTTGWGRESGGDAWKQYVRWSACTVNFSRDAPLAQGVNFPAVKWED